MNSYGLTISVGGPEAARILALALTGNRQQAALARAAIRENPGAALAVIAENGGELTVIGQGRLLDQVIGQIADPDEARDLVEGTLARPLRVCIMTAQSDLPTAAAQVLAIDDVVEAMLGDMDEDSAQALLQRLVVMQSWMVNLKDRSDYAELLAHEVGGYSLKSLLVFSIALEHGLDEDDSDASSVPDSAFVEFGLDADEARELLLEMLASELVELIDEDDIARAKEALAAKRRAVQGAPTLASEAVQTATSVASGSDL